MNSYSTLAAAITNLEGWFTGSLSQRNNNPGNLMYAGQAGAIGADANGLAIFASLADGQQALQNQISLDANRGETIADFAAKYAPAAAGNNPTAYAAQLAAATGLSVNDPLSATSDGTAGGGGGDAYTAVSALPDSIGNPLDNTGDYPTMDLSAIGLGEIVFTPEMMLGVGAALVGLLWLMNRSRNT